MKQSFTVGSELLGEWNNSQNAYSKAPFFFPFVLCLIFLHISSTSTSLHLRVRFFDPKLALLLLPTRSFSLLSSLLWALDSLSRC